MPVNNCCPPEGGTRGPRLLVALGGNAILKHRGTGTAEEQFANVRETCRELVGMIREGYRIAITHGNGPQVGDILLKNECAKESLPMMPLDVCGAESQGMIGYFFQQSMDRELTSAGLSCPVVTVLTQTRVDPDDPAFRSPSKPIGPFYTHFEASRLREEKGWVVVNDAGRGWRRVVPSPEPVEIVEGSSLATLYEEGMIVIACGGGGIPVIRVPDGSLSGVEAVIDKDHSAALFATLIRADILLILTDVERIALNFGRPDQRDLTAMTVSEAERYLSAGHFAPGSMGPKVEAAIRFVRAGGERAIVTSLVKGLEALEGRAGTTITKG
jgi:carbamate kinase